MRKPRITGRNPVRRKPRRRTGAAAGIPVGTGITVSYRGTPFCRVHRHGPKSYHWHDVDNRHRRGRAGTLIAAITAAKAARRNVL